LARSSATIASTVFLRASRSPLAPDFTKLIRRSLRAIVASLFIATAASPVGEFGIRNVYANGAEPAQHDGSNVFTPICAHECNLAPYRFRHHDLDRHFSLCMLPLTPARGRGARGWILARHM